MNTRPVKQPDAAHPISIEPNRARVIVRVGGRIVADTRDALTLYEAGFPPVQYIPRRDVDESSLHLTDHATYCPYKGDASYFSVDVDGLVSENAAWSYEQAYEAVAPIAGHLAFYPDRVDAIEVLR